LTPTNPTPTPTPTPPPTPTGLAIQGPNTLRTGQTQNYSAILSLSNGTTQSVTPTWGSDNASVLTVNSSGQGNALMHGAATVIASAQGVSASMLVKVYQDYQGAWVGSHRVRVCDERGDFKGICRAVFTLGALLPFGITLTQNASSGTGTVTLGLHDVSMNGTIFDSRRFVGAGSGTHRSEGIMFIDKIGTLDLLSNGNGLSGTMVFTVEASGFTGNTYVESELSGVTRISSTMRAAPRMSFSSVDEYLRAFTIVGR
jgi:hypothetical protein